MKVIVTTSDKYSCLLKGFSALFNKYWADTQEVIILGYARPGFELPNNFTFVSLGEQPDANDWTSPLIPFFEDFKDEYFTLMMEDHYIVENVDVSTINKACSLFDEHKIDKFYLGDWGTKPGKEDLILWKDSRYRMSLFMDPGIWSTELFKKILSPNLTWHQLEKVSGITSSNTNTMYSRIVPLWHIDATRHNHFSILDMKHYRGPAIKNEDMSIYEEAKKDFISINGNITCEQCNIL